MYIVQQGVNHENSDATPTQPTKFHLPNCVTQPEPTPPAGPYN